VPPEGNTYAGNGTPNQNESNYGVLRISHLGNLATVTDPGPGDQVSLEVGVTSEGNVTISWTGSGVTLHTASEVNGAYTPAGLPVVTEGDRHTVTVTPSAARAFYRAQ
jgi:hypothetical protein